MLVHIVRYYLFTLVCARRDVDLVDKAIEQMRARILQLVNDSVRDQLYPKALECMRALREGALQEGEADAFNKFLRELRGFYERKRRDDFWQQVTYHHFKWVKGGMHFLMRVL